MSLSIPGTGKKIQMTITVDKETKDRLRCYAYQHRMNLSNAITYLIWDVKEIDMSVLDELNKMRDMGD